MCYIYDDTVYFRHACRTKAFILYAALPQRQCCLEFQKEQLMSEETNLMWY